MNFVNTYKDQYVARYDTDMFDTGFKALFFTIMLMPMIPFVMHVFSETLPIVSIIIGFIVLYQIAIGIFLSIILIVNKTSNRNKDWSLNLVWLTSISVGILLVQEFVTYPTSGLILLLFAALPFIGAAILIVNHNNDTLSEITV